MTTASYRKIAVLLVAAVLLAPWSAAAEPTRLADWLTTLWSVAFGVFPYGSDSPRVTLPPTENLDNGCKMDPFGGCRNGSTTPAPAPNADNGCRMDPFGGCAPLAGAGT